MMPIEYIYGDWYRLIAKDEALRSNPDYIGSREEVDIEVGSQAEGFCIPEMHVPKNTDHFLRYEDLEHAPEYLQLDLDDTEHWISDHDTMTVNDSFLLNEQKLPVSIFSEVFHAEYDPRYVKLKLTEEWKTFRKRFKDSTFLHQSYLLPGKSSFYQSILDTLNTSTRGEKVKWTFDVHGPVRKMESRGNWIKLEEDRANVFKFPQAWPEPAMEWLVRPRNGSWPSPGLVQDVFESGCHIAPVGRGKRSQDPVELIKYLKDPSNSQENSKQQNSSDMDEHEWRLSFSVAENKLAQSVSPVQRHVMILLKMLKQFYINDNCISTYLLKNLLFWEIEKQAESFWKEDNSAKCLLHMLSRLQQCFEEGCLPHYIMPESNLLAYEDPYKLAEAARFIFDIRQTILPKSISMLQRSFTLTYQSCIFHRRLFLELFLDKLHDETLHDCEIKEMVCSLLLLFKSRSKECVERLMFRQKSDVRPEIIIALNTYESLLARCLSKAWLVLYSVNVNEEKFIDFVKSECESFSTSDELLKLSLAFYKHACEGKDIGNLVPYTSAMISIKKMSKLSEERSLEEGKLVQKYALYGMCRSDLDQAEKKVLDFMKDVNIDDVQPKDLEAQYIDTLLDILRKKIGLA